MKHFIFCLLLSLLSFPVISQNTWSLQACVEHALKENVSVQQSVLGVNYAKNGLIQSKLNFLPSVNASTGYNFNFGNSVDPTTYAYIKDASRSANFSLSAGLDLFSGLQNWQNMRKAESDLQAGIADVETMSNNIALSVTSSFLQIMLARDALASAQSQQSLTKEQYTRTKLLVEAGALPESNLLDMEAQLATEEMNVTTAENNEALAINSMKILLQLDPASSFDIEIPKLNMSLEDLNKMNPYAIYTTAIQERSEIRSAEFKLQSARHSYRLAQSALFPRLSFYAQLGSNYFNKASDITYSTIDNPSIGYLASDPTQEVLSNTSFSVVSNIQPTPFEKQLKNNFSQGMGLSLSVPIFNKWQVRTSIDNAKLGIRSAELGLTASQNDLRDKIYSAYMQAKAAEKTLLAAGKQEAAVKASYDQAIKKFDVGAISSFDVNQLKDMYFKTQLENLRAKYDFVFKYKMLELYSGKSWNELF